MEDIAKHFAVYVINSLFWKRKCYFTKNADECLLRRGQVDTTEFAESAESTENHNFLSSLIMQPKNYP